MKDKILSILATEKKLHGKSFAQERALPENCFLLGNGEVICYPRATGDSRYPYSCDGLTLWAYASGEMSLNESAFYYILPFDEGKEPYVAFFGGQKSRSGFTPVSITGVARRANENVKRFTYYTPQAAYYIAKTKDVVYALRVTVSDKKQALFSTLALNVSNKPATVYLSAFFNCLLMHQAGESVETKWFKRCDVTNHGFIFESVEDIDRTTHLKNYGVINRAVGFTPDYCEHTTSRADYCGGKTNSLSFATPLYTGYFKRQKHVCKFGDTAAAGDIYCVTLPPDGCARIDYCAEAYFDKREAFSAVHEMSPHYADDYIANAERGYSAPSLEMTFGKATERALIGKPLTEFVANVERQTEFAALAKNSGTSLLGVRDVAQQLEAALMWNAPACRKKFTELFGFIDPSGRAPRQYSLPAKGALPQTDTRAFIDQGNWIISAVYTYLAFTDDISLLDEVCGYYKIVGRNRVERCDERNSIAEHLMRITDYMLANRDTDTGMLRALYGDWNDALDGLGVSADPDVEFGSGVSVMASLHLYKNLNEMLDIIDKYGDKFDKKQEYSTAAQALKASLLKYAVHTNGSERKIVHGWGDKRGYYVGSFNDCDGKSRDGLTSNAFWVICGAYPWDTSIKTDILKSYDRLDGKYGLKTFEPYFAPDTKGVGRIINLPEGTAENAATYVHATLFGIWSLFGMNEPKRAWDQLIKVLPLTHDMITTTPFVMSNSYSYNEELDLDGESMSDWFTGSANTLIKTLVWCAFGLKPDLDGLHVRPPMYFPFDGATISVTVKGKRVTLIYKNAKLGKREITFNGKPVNARPDESTDTAFYIRSNDLEETNVITVTD